MSLNYQRKGRGKLGSNDFSQYSEHDDRSIPQRRNVRNNDYQRKMTSYRGNSRRGGGRYRGNRGHNNNFRGSFRGRGRRPSGSHGRGGGYRYQAKDDLSKIDASPFHTDKDGDISMDGEEDSTNRRFNPYARPKRYQKSAATSHQESMDKSWHRVWIPNGSKLDEDWLIQEIQSMANINFQPIEYHMDKDDAVFFTQDQSAAEAIRSCSKRISSPDYPRIVLVVKRANIPPLNSMQVEKIKEVLGERYSNADQHIDLSSFFDEEKLKNSRVKLHSFYHAFVVGRLIADHIASLTSIDLSNNSLRSCQQFKYLVNRTPSVKKLNLKNNKLDQFMDMSCLRLWDLTELVVDQNPLCASYKSHTEYISDAREYFPNLLILDGHSLPPPVKFDVDSGKLPKAIKDHFSPSGQDVINNFIQKYFQCYDQSRINLMEAYNDFALLTITIPSSPRGPTLSKYFDSNRNLKRLKKGRDGNQSKVFSNRSDVVNQLARLPSTQHFFASFAIDVPMVTTSMVNFIVRGCFKESGSNGYLRAFSRSFFCRAQQASLEIINELYFIRNPTAAEIKQVKTLEANPQPVIQADSQYSEMIASFMKESGMNTKFSKQCLQENDWNYEKAATVFLKLKSERRIPAEAYEN